MASFDRPRSAGENLVRPLQSPAMPRAPDQRANNKARTILQQLEATKQRHDEEIRMVAEYVTQQHVLERELEATTLAQAHEIQGLKGEIHNLVRQIQDLKVELSFAQTGWEATRQENTHLRSERTIIQSSLNVYQKDKPLKVCLIDGNKALFDERLVAEGASGGRKAASLLNSKLQQTFHNDVPDKIQKQGLTVVMVFMDVQRVGRTFISNGVGSAADFERFVWAFNQAFPLFSILDVGSGDDAASIKLRESLLLCSRLRQMSTVVTAGLQGGATALRGLQALGLLNKITILKGGRENSLKDEALPMSVLSNAIEIPGLFSQQELVPHSGGPTAYPQANSSLVACLIDGYQLVFNDELVAKGRAGGREAAVFLQQGIMKWLGDQQVKGATPGIQHQVMANVFVDAAGLADDLAFNGICSTRDFEQFLLGFNQATPLFTMVDVGPEEEAANEKIRETLLSYCRLRQTSQIILGGAHANNHIQALQTLKTEGLLGNVTILRGGAKLPPEAEKFYKNASMAMMEIPELFSLRNSTSSSEQPPDQVVPSKHVPNSTGPSRQSTSIAPSPQPSLYKAPIGPTSLTINPKKAMLKQSPPLCSYHYLTSCSKNTRCGFSHQYILTPEQMDTLRAELKKIPCTVQKNAMKSYQRKCPSSADACLMSHYCPDGPSCARQAKNKCPFKGRDMHKAQPDAMSLVGASSTRS